MNLSDGIKLYVADRRAKGKAANTVRNEEHHLKLLLADIGNINLNQLRPQHFDTYWSRRTTWGEGTMNLAQANLNSFIKWCQARGHIRRDRNPLEGVRRLKVPPRKRVIIPQPEWSTFLEEQSDPRTRAICALGLYLFLRIGETAGLRVQDLDRHNGIAYIYREKTKELDDLPICAELDAELGRWFLAYAGMIGRPLRPGDYVIPGLKPGASVGIKGQKGKWRVVRPPEYLPTTRSNPSYSIRKALKGAGYYVPYEGGHTLRRSGATALYNELTRLGHDRAIRICQAMLGHANVTTTEVYLRLDLDRKVRNDLYAGKLMFPATEEARIIEIGVKDVR